MSPPIPSKMKALVLEEFGKPLVYKQVPIPRLKHNEVLVKIEFAPLNPMDLSFIKGSYSSVKNLPVTPGFEGSGTIVASGGGLYAWSLVGKRAAVYVQRNPNGCFAEYAVTSAYTCIPLPNHITFEEASSGFVNPFTVIMMHRKAVSMQVKAVISNPGASAVGRMILRYFTANGIKVINIVRREEQAEMLKKEENAEFVLNSSDTNFTKELRRLSLKIGATVCFDAVGGEVSGKILSGMPDGSTTFIYGNLSMKNSEATQTDLIFKGKKMHGFWLVSEMKKNSMLDTYFTAKRMSMMYNDVLGTRFVRKYPLTKFDEAVRFYLKNMTEGKVLLNPNSLVTEDIFHPSPNSSLSLPVLEQSNPSEQQQQSSSSFETKIESADNIHRINGEDRSHLPSVIFPSPKL